MIALETLKEALKNQIESINTDKGFGYNFHIVSDTGEYRPPERYENNVTEYIQGVFTVTGSDVSELNGGYLYAKQDCNLQLAFELPNHTEDREYNGLTIKGSERKVREIREILEELASAQRYEELTDENNTTFFVTTTYSIASSGVRNQIAQEGDSYTFSLFVGYYFVENGVNSRNVTFKLNGVPFPYQVGTLNTAKTFESNAYSNSDGAVKNLPIQSNWSVTFELPALVGQNFISFLRELNGTNDMETAYALEYTINGGVNGWTYQKLVHIGEINLNFETNLNATIKVPFYEASTNYLNVVFPTGTIISYDANVRLTYRGSGTCLLVIYNKETLELSRLASVAQNGAVILTATQFGVLLAGDNNFVAQPI